MVNKKTVAVVLGGALVAAGAGVLGWYMWRKSRDDVIPSDVVFNSATDTDSVSGAKCEGGNVQVSDGWLVIQPNQQSLWSTGAKIPKLPAGTVEFEYMPDWDGLPGALGQPLIRIGEWPHSFDFGMVGSDLGWMNIRAGEKEKNDGYVFHAKKGTAYKWTMTWDSVKKEATLYLDGKVVSHVTDLDMSAFTDTSKVVLPPGAQKAGYKNIIIRKGAKAPLPKWIFF